MTQWEEIADIMQEMLASGYDFALGPHAPGMTGFYACFIQCDGEDGNLNFCDWDDCGHAESPLEAVEMARAIALELPVEIPASESFLP